MTKRSQKESSVSTSVKPTRRDRFLPAELLGISAGLGGFAGFIALISTRDFPLAGIAFGLTFILCLVLMALFALAFKPTAAEAADIDAQNMAPDKSPESPADDRNATDTEGPARH